MRSMHEAGKLVRVLFRHTSVLPLARLVLGVHLVPWAFAAVERLPERVMVDRNGPWLFDGQAFLALKPNSATINMNHIHFEILNQLLYASFSPVIALGGPFYGNRTPPDDDIRELPFQSSSRFSSIRACGSATVSCHRVFVG